MKLGIFAKTLSRSTIEELFQSIAAYEIDSVQFNLSCAGLDPLPENVPAEVAQRIADSAAQANVELSAISGTFNMAHPDSVDRSGNLIKFEALCEVAATLHIPVITLCSGSRDPVNMWKWHPENDSKGAWDDMVETMASALIAAEKNNLILAFEPESENVVNSATRARKLLNELGDPRLRTVIDPANLISPGCNQKEIINEAFALLGDSIVIAHAKDRDSNFQACAAGKGILDFEYYLRCAKQSGFTGPLIMHGLDERDVADAREFLRRTLANVGSIS